MTKDNSKAHPSLMLVKGVGHTIEFRLLDELIDDGEQHIHLGTMRWNQDRNTPSLCNVNSGGCTFSYYPLIVPMHYVCLMRKDYKGWDIINTCKSRWIKV